MYENCCRNNSDVAEADPLADFVLNASRFNNDTLGVSCAGKNWMKDQIKEEMKGNSVGVFNPLGIASDVVSGRLKPTEPGIKSEAMLA